MFNNKFTRLASLLLTLGLICGFMTAGCRDVARETSDVPSVSKVIYYKFNTAAAKIDFAQAQYVSVTAVDTHNEYVLAELSEDKISDMKEEGTYRFVETILSDEADRVMYTFYHEDPDDSERLIGDGYAVINVYGVEDGKVIEVNEEQEYKVSLILKDKEGNETSEFAVGDDVYVEVHGYYYGKDVNFSGDGSATLVSSDEKVLKVVPGYDAEHNSLKCQAVGEGEVNLSVICNDVWNEDLATAQVAQGELRQMYYVAKNFYDLSEEGYLKIGDLAIQTCEQLVEAMETGVEPLTPGEENSIDWIPIYYVDNAGGRARFEIGNDPADDTEVVIQVTGGDKRHFADTTYRNGVITVKWSNETVEGEKVNVSLNAPGYESKGDIVLRFEESE